MIDMVRAKDILLDIPYISNTIIQENSPYINKGFSQGLQCNLLLKNQSVKLFIGIPRAWDRELVSIYVVDFSALPFMPHVEPDGKLCLFDLEGVLIDQNFEGLLEQCIRRAKEILEKGFYSNNDSEFAREFSSYWSYQTPKRYMKFVVPENHKTQLIKYCDPAAMLRQKKKEKLVSFENRKNKTEMFAASEPSYFSLWKVSGSQLNGIFFHLEPNDYILPPDPRKRLGLEYVQMLVSYIPSDDLIQWKFKINTSTLIVFEILQPGHEVACFGIMLKNILIEADKEYLNIKPSSKMYEVTAVDISRIDDEFLMQRTQADKNSQTPNVLLIGCGSIGGYLCSELVKAGYKNLTLVDGDILKAENIYRHFLGMDYVGKYKAEALRVYCTYSFPQVIIKTLDSNAEELIEDGSIELGDFDVIISATGNHNFNRWLNRHIYQEHVKVPCIYLWNEPLDVGCHLAIIHPDSQGCYECFFARDTEKNELYDVTAYTKPGQTVTKSSRGCSGTFVPYSSNVSLCTVSVCLEWMERLSTGRCNRNVLVSIKGDAYHFNKAGYECSDVYYEQNIKENIIEGSNFHNEFCELCGEYTNGD